MDTREEHSRKVKRNRLINRVLIFVVTSIFLSALIVSYLDSLNSDVEVVSEWYECKLNSCEYRVTIKNTTKLRKNAFIRVTAYYKKVHPEGGDTYPVVNSKRIELNLKQNEEKELIGQISVPLRAHVVRFVVGTV